MSYVFCSPARKILEQLERRLAMIRALAGENPYLLARPQAEGWVIIERVNHNPLKCCLCSLAGDPRLCCSYCKPETLRLPPLECGLCGRVLIRGRIPNRSVICVYCRRRKKK